MEDWKIKGWELPGFDNKEDDIQFKYKLTLEFNTLEQKKEWIELANNNGVKIAKGLNWGRGEETEHRCDLIPRIKRYKQRDFYYTATFHNTCEGERLSVIKTIDNNVNLFADAAENLIRELLTKSTRLISAPARRHKVNNFTTRVCTMLANRLDVIYDSEAVKMNSSDRFRPDFYVDIPISQERIIIYDDIVTTGKTIMELHRLFEGKEIYVIVGIENDRPIKSV